MAIISLVFLSISPWLDPTRGESPRGVRRMTLSARPQLTSTTAAGLVAATSTPASVARLSASGKVTLPKRAVPLSARTLPATHPALIGLIGVAAGLRDDAFALGVRALQQR